MTVFRLLALTMVLLTSAPAFPCSALSVKSEKHVIDGRNLDWNFGHGFLIVNPRGLRKTALIGAPFTPAHWTSRYGSLTFNQVGRELPYGGINESGLDVEALWLRSAVFPNDPAKPTVNELQWVQYQLDNFSSVAEVLANIDKIGVTDRFAKLHYFLCDVSGNCAVVDPIAGKLVVHSEAISALTNDTYQDSVSYARIFSGGRSAPAGAKSLARFARLSAFLTGRSNSPSMDDLFSVLSNVSSPISNDDDDKTQWSVVNNLKDRVVYFKTLESPSIKSVNLAKFKFSCVQTAVAIDINSRASGDVTNRLAPYTKAQNQDIVSRSLATGFAHLPPEAIARVTDYADNLTCEK